MAGQKFPPNLTLEAEQALLGAILLRSEVLDEIIETVQPEDFYRTGNGKIFKAIRYLYNNQTPVDLVTVTQQLMEAGLLEECGGAIYLAELSEHVGTAVNAPYYAKVVREKSLIRQVETRCKKILNSCSKPIENTVDFLQWAESQLYEVTQNGNSLRRKRQNFNGVGDLVLEISDFLKIDLKPKRPILHPWLSENQIIMIYGSRGVGKTMFVMGLLNAITSGVPFGPWKTVTPASCLYLDGEMPPQDTIERFSFLADGERKAKLFIYSDAYANSLGIPRANLLDEEWRKAMQEILLQKNIRVWVVDNIASLAPGIDENSKQDWDPINQWFLELRAANVTTIFLHHANREGGQRGTSAREDNIDISVLLEKPKDYVPENGAKFIVKFQKSRIPHHDLALIKDIEFQLEVFEDGSYVWTFGSLKKQTKAEVIRMLDEGVAAKNIASSLKISPARVSQIRGEALKDGLITEAGKLTQTGFEWLQKV